MPTPIIMDKGCGTIVVAILLIATPCNKIYHILLPRNYVYMFVNLEKNQEHNNKH